MEVIQGGNVGLVMVVGLFAVFLFCFLFLIFFLQLMRIRQENLWEGEGLMRGLSYWL